MSKADSKVLEIKFNSAVRFNAESIFLQKMDGGELHRLVIIPEKGLGASFFCDLDSLDVLVIGPNDLVDCEITVFGASLHEEMVQEGSVFSLHSQKLIGSGKIEKILEKKEYPIDMDNIKASPIVPKSASEFLE